MSDPRDSGSYAVAVVIPFTIKLVRPNNRKKLACGSFLCC